MSFARNVATVGGATLASRLLGFARDIAIASLFGAGMRADAFFVAFQLANLTRRLLAEGALNAAVVPLYLRARDGEGDAAAARFAGRLIGTFTLVFLGLAALLALATPAVVLVLAPGFKFGDARMTLAVEMARLMLPYLVIAAPLAVMIGVLNANKRFAASAFSPVIFNVVMLGALFAVHLLHRGNSDVSGRILAGAVGVAALVQLILIGIAVVASRTKVTPLSVSFGPQVRRFVALALPAMIASGIPQIVVIGGTMMASASPSAVSWIYYANRLIELPLGIVGIAIGTVLVPTFAHAIRTGSRRDRIEAESRGIELSIGLALPAAIALALLAGPIVRVLFERGAFSAGDATATATALAALALGLPGHVLVKTFAPIFYAREDTGTPMRAALFGFIVAIGLSIVLMPELGHVGIALALAISGWASAVLLGVLVARRFGFSIDRGARRRVPLIVLSALLMGLALEGGHRGLAFALEAGAATWPRIGALSGLIALGLFVYLALLWVLRVVSPRDLWRALRHGL